MNSRGVSMTILLLPQEGEAKLLEASNELRAREARLQNEAEELTSRSDALDRRQAQLSAREVCCWDGYP